MPKAPQSPNVHLSQFKEAPHKALHAAAVLRACSSCMQGMELEAAKVAVDSAKDTQLITLNKLLTPPELGSGSRSGSDSDDAEAHLQPYALEHDAAGPAPGQQSGPAQGQSRRACSLCRHIGIRAKHKVAAQQVKGQWWQAATVCIGQCSKVALAHSST